MVNVQDAMSLLKVLILPIQNALFSAVLGSFFQLTQFIRTTQFNLFGKFVLVVTYFYSFMFDLSSWTRSS